MVKYCMSCGSQNDDQAAFCTACGKRFQDEPSASQVQQTSAPTATTQQSTLLTAEKGTGAHKHMPTDVFLKDASGRVLLVARRPSLLHENYDIVDGNEGVAGYLKPINHLTHSGLGVEDGSHTLQAAVQRSNMQSSSQLGPLTRQNPPNCWIENPVGDKLVTLVFTNWVLGFSAVKPEGSTVFDVSLTGGTGLRQQLSAMENKAYSINLYDSTFPLPTLLAVIVVVDKIGGG